MTKFKTFKDKLIEEYWNNHPGTLFMEVEVGDIGGGRKRRIDGVLIPGGEKEVYFRSEFNEKDLLEKVKGKKIEVIEAKRRLNRNVIGQTEVAKFLSEKDFKPAKVKPVVLCSKDHSDLRNYCKFKGIELFIYKRKLKKKTENTGDDFEERDVEDVRGKPSKYKKSAFLSGWKDAEEGKLYYSIEDRKTHQNMGNLFGWIYGNISKKEKNKIWKQYIKNNKKFLNKDW